MKPELELKTARLVLEEREASVGDFLDIAGNYLKSAWLLAESPRKFVFEAFGGELASELQTEATSLIVFGPHAEIRFERPYGAQGGWLRLARPDSAGEECLVRSIGALLRDGSGRRLLFEEYYRADESGFLLNFCRRLRGVEAS